MGGIRSASSALLNGQAPAIRILAAVARIPSR